MSVERMKVLEMLVAGKITIDQANQLIEALNGEHDGLAEGHPEGGARSDSAAVILEPQQIPAQQDWYITNELTLHSLAPGSVTVASGGYLMLHGRVAQDLILESGASVDFRGSVGRDLYNQSDASIDIYGLVEGDVYNSSGSRINLYGQIEGDVYSRPEGMTVFGVIKGNMREERHIEESDGCSCFH